jgi:hypothetical protein
MMLVMYYRRCVVNLNVRLSGGQPLHNRRHPHDKGRTRHSRCTTFSKHAEYIYRVCTSDMATCDNDLTSGSLYVLSWQEIRCDSDSLRHAKGAITTCHHNESKDPGMK